MEPSRKVSNTCIEVFPLVIGGHSFSHLPGKTMPTDEEAVALLETLVAGGGTHFDCTWSSERQAYRRLLEHKGLRERLQPIIWHGWHDYEEKTAGDMVRAFRGVLGELGYDKASMLILNQWDHTDAHKHFYVHQDKSHGFAEWFWEGVEEIKRLGLVDAIGWAVEPGPLNAPFLTDNHVRIDFLALYWNYRNRQNQNLVELAKAYQLGIYAVAPFGRGGGSLFNLPGIDPAKIIRPWLKWVLSETSVFAMPISLPSLAEAKQTLAAFDDTKFSPDDADILQQCLAG
jgi:aryl-alcohol dehydrogenase-like predicted oxidoreductase